MNLGFISLLAASPAQRSRGIGSALVAAASERAAATGMRELRLQVRAADRRALRFYQHRGFQITRTDGADLILAKPLGF